MNLVLNLHVYLHIYSPKRHWCTMNGLSLIFNLYTSDRTICMPMAIVTAMPKLFELCLSKILDKYSCSSKN